MGMARQDSALAQQEFCHQRVLAVNQRFAFNPVQGWAVSSIASLLEHGYQATKRGRVAQ
jgi:hypothetical protein